MYDNCNMFYVLILFRLSAVLGSIDVISGSKTTLFSVARGKRFTSSFGQFISRSKIDCCRECVSKSGCLSVNFSNLTNVCEFVALPSLAIQAYSRTETSWNIYATDVSEWLLVFRGTAHIGGDIYDAWVNGNGVVTNDVNCMRLDVMTCTHHYRNTIVDTWSAVGITRVKLSVFKEAQEKHYIIFDGSGTDHVSWFASTKIISSSWTDLSSHTFNFFSLAGFEARRFYISRFWSGCPNDNGYLLVSAVAPDGTWVPCNFDFHNSYPTIMYAESTSGGGIFETQTSIGEADFIAIFISTS